MHPRPAPPSGNRARTGEAAAPRPPGTALVPPPARDPWKRIGPRPEGRSADFRDAVSRRLQAPWPGAWIPAGTRTRRTGRPPDPHPAAADSEGIALRPLVPVLERDAE